jgi:hypothetical protein
MISNAFALKLRFGGASCSLGPLADPSSNTEASHPCIANYTLWTSLKAYDIQGLNSDPMSYIFLLPEQSSHGSGDEASQRLGQCLS